MARDELVIEIYLSGKHTRNRQIGNACNKFNERKNELKMTREKERRKMRNRIRKKRNNCGNNRDVFPI
jgi:hypothetical protein